MFGHTLPRLYFSQNTINGQRLFAHDLSGNNIFTSTNGYGLPPAVAPDENLRHYNRSLSAANGSVLYTFNSSTQTSLQADAGSDNTHYLVQSFCRLFAVNPDGTQKWRFDDIFQGTCGILNEPVVSPANNVVVVGGRLNFGQPGFFTAVNAGDGLQAWKMILPNEPGFEDVYNNLVPMNRPVFAPGGGTAYASVWIAASPGFSYFYAVNTTSDSVPVNQPPVLTITNPANNSNLPRNSVVDVRALAQDTGPVERVEFRLRNAASQESTLIGIDTTPDANGEYTASFTTTAPGGYAIDVTAYDTGGLSDSEYVYVSVQNQYPSISWVSPVDEAVISPAPASLTLTAHAADSDGTVTSVDFYNSINGFIGTDNTPDANGNFSVQWANPPVGPVTLAAWANDNDTGRTDSLISITIGEIPTPTPTPTATPTPPPVGQPPVVSIASPADGIIVSPGTSVAVTADGFGSGRYHHPGRLLPGFLQPVHQY